MGSGAADYTVVTAYRIDDQATNKASGIADSIGKGLAGAASSAAAAFDSVISKVMALGAAGASMAAAGAIYGIKKGLVDVNANLEDSRIGFATLFNMFGASNGMEQGLRMSGELVEGIRKDAQILPGEFQDFVGVAQTLTSPMLQMGKGLIDIRNLTKDTVVAAAALKLPFDMAGREMTELISKGMTLHNTLGRSLGFKKDDVLKSGTTFNLGTDAERLEFITEKLKNAKESLPYLARSWGGLTSTMVDGMKALLGKATLPLFERIKDTVGGINDLLSGDKAMAIADAVGKYLVNAYDWIGKKTEWIGAHWGEIAQSATKFGHEIHDAFEKAWPIIEKIANLLGEKLKDPGKLIQQLAMLRGGLGLAQMAPGMAGGVGQFAKLMGGADAGAGGTIAKTTAEKLGATGFGSFKKAAASEGAALGTHSADMANHIQWGGNMLGADAPMLVNPLLAGGGAAESAGGAAAVAGGAGAEGLGLGLGAVGAAAVVAAAALVALGGAVDVATVNTQSQSGVLAWMGEIGQAMWGDLKKNFGGMWDDLKNFFADFMVLIRPIADILGVVLIAAVDGVVYGLRLLLAPMEALGWAIAWLVKKIPGYGNTSLGAGMGTVDGIQSREQLAAAEKLQDEADANIKKMGLLGEQRSQKQDNEDAKMRQAALAKGALHGKGQTVVNVNAPITINSSDDPERVAMRVASHIEGSLRNPKRATGYTSMLQE